MKDSSNYASSSIKPFCEDVSARSEDVSSYSVRTQQILNFMVEHTEPQQACFLAIQLNQPRKCVHQTLTRLIKKGIVVKTEQGFSLSKDVFAQIYAKSRPIRRGRVREFRDLLRVHCVSLVGRVDRLFGRLVDVGTLQGFELRNIGGCYRGRSLVLDGEVRLFPNDSVSFQRHCEPVPLRNLGLMGEDLDRTVGYLTGGLGHVDSVYARGFELGLDVPCSNGLFDGVSRVEIYRKRKKARIHVQFSGLGDRLKVPLSVEDEERLKDVWLGKLDRTGEVLRDARLTVSGRSVPSQMDQFLSVLRSLWTDEEFNKMVIERAFRKLHDEYDQNEI